MTIITSVVAGFLGLLLLWWVGEKLISSYAKTKWSANHLGDESFNYWMGVHNKRGG